MDSNLIVLFRKYWDINIVDRNMVVAKCESEHFKVSVSACQIFLHINIFHLCELRLRKLINFTIVKIALISVVLIVSGKAFESCSNELNDTGFW